MLVPAGRPALSTGNLLVNLDRQVALFLFIRF